MKSFGIPHYLRDVLLMTIGVIAMFYFRNWVVGDNTYDWLMSNLFSGFIPLLVAFLLFKFQDRVPGFLFWIGCFLWFIFYPNGPYMMIDVIHTNLAPITTDALSGPVDLCGELPVTSANYPGRNILFVDAFVIYSIGLLSVYYGLLSLKMMYSIFKSKWNSKWAKAILALTIILSCVAFVIGRIPPVLYSSDIYKDPMKVLTITYEHFFPILCNKASYWLMVLFGGLQVMLLVITRDVSGVESKAATNPNLKP